MSTPLLIRPPLQLGTEELGAFLELPIGHSSTFSTVISSTMFRALTKSKENVRNVRESGVRILVDILVDGRINLRGLNFFLF